VQNSQETDQGDRAQVVSVMSTLDKHQQQSLQGCGKLVPELTELCYHFETSLDQLLTG
jgi:hypothetical protein